MRTGFIPKSASVRGSTLFVFMALNMIFAIMLIVLGSTTDNEKLTVAALLLLLLATFTAILGATGGGRVDIKFATKT